MRSCVEKMGDHQPARAVIGDGPSVRQRLRLVIKRMISIADRPDDDDDTRLRKRVGVVAGYLRLSRRSA